MKKIFLSDQWTMRKSDENKSYTLDVPGSVYSTLLECNEIPHPHIGKNENITAYSVDGDYIFEKKFEIETDILQAKQIDLICEGLDTVCDIYVNDIKLKYCNDMHVKYRIAIKELLKEGENSLRIYFYSPLDYIEKKDKEVRLWENTYCLHGFSHIRKAHYMFGWDWGPVVPDIGIWKDVYLEVYDGARLESVYITQKHSDEGVELSIVPEAVVADGMDYEYEITITNPDNEKTILSANGECSVMINNPKLWYPNGYGQQPLYKVETVLLCGGKEADRKKYTIGLREVELVNKEDEYGKSFFFRVNGLDIFAKGANYIPEDNLLNNRREKAEHLLKSCKMSHFNMLRIWGGGIYQDDEFYERCSEYGIMIWQDCMYACATCKYDDETEKNITDEVTTQLKRLRNYPCIVLWAGNNEVEDMIGFGCATNERLVNERVDYVKMFHHLIPNLMKEHHPEAIYKTSSPTSDTCFFEANAYTKGDVHFWKVWHDLLPFSEYRKHLFRFCSEFGFQSIPCIETVKTFADDEDLNLFSPVMEHHQKFGAGNSKILHYLAENFRYPNSFENLIYISQIMQGEAIGTGVEHWRSNRGICMGSLYWQLNDCWPGVTWSSIDCYGRWKALQYFAKRFYAPILLTAAEKDGFVEFAVSNDTQNILNSIIFWEVRDMDDKVLVQGEIPCTVNELSAQKMKKVDLSEYISDADCYIHYSLYIDGEKTVSRILLPKANKSYCFKKPDISSEVKKDEKGVYIEIYADCLARYVRMSAMDNDVIFEDNYFDLVPGEIRKIYVLNCEDSEKVKGTLKITNLTDTY